MDTRHIPHLKIMIGCCVAQACLQWTAWGATLVNRYNFNETIGVVATDSVSGANALLTNGASFNGSGQAVLTQIAEDPSSDTAGEYIILPPNLFTNYSAVTLEAWVTPTLDGTDPWTRIWDFGNSSTNGVGMYGINGFFYARMGDLNGDSCEADSYKAGLGDNWNFSTTAMNSGVENHIVWTADGNTHIAKLYINGVLVSTIYTFTNSPAVVGSTTNDWLGRSQFASDPLAVADYDEFRIYNGPISALQVAADYQNSPDTLASYGTVTGLALQFNATNIPVGSSQTPQLMATASGLSSPVDIHDDPGVTWTSSATNVALVDAHGTVTGLSLGTATIVGAYDSLAVTQIVTVISLPVTILHRYSFSETSGTVAHDSIDTSGNSDGTLNGDAVFDGNGQAVLDGTAGTWVDLPAHLLDATNITANAVTLEAWATFYPVNGAWTRLFDFGNISGNNGANYLFFAPNTANNGGNCRVAVSDASPGYTGEDGFDLHNVLGQTNIHVVVVFNPNPLRKFLGLYTNGVFAGSITTTKPYSSIINDYSFLGRSTYAGDSWLNGSLSEFRIYNGELNKFQIAASDQAGPDKTNFDVGTFTSFDVNPGATPIAAGVIRQVRAIMNFTQASNVVVNGDATLTFASSDTNVATINNAGSLYAKNTGTTTITAIYGYVPTLGASATYYTNSATVSVVKDYPATLMHRYSFTTDASDSVGGAAWTGTLNGSAAVSNGQLVLSNATTGLATDYLQLPPGILTNSVNGVGTNDNDPAVTIEAWASFAPLQGGWANLFDFGVQSSKDGLTPGNDAYSISLCVHSGTGTTGHTIAGISDTDDANVNRDNADAGTGSGLDGKTNLQIVVVFDPPAGYEAVYTNGVLMVENNNATISMAGIQGIRNIIGADNWPDGGVIGSMDEFRIYNGVLDPNQIAHDYLLGPNVLPSTAPALQAAVSGGNLLVSWPTNGSTGFILQSSPALGAGAAWTPVSGTPSVAGQNYQVNVPLTNSARFFELKQ